jgi:ligand-binding SRPBCC domain-containing protein
MIYFEDRGAIYDAPLEVVWDFIEKDETFHPKAHAATLRNFESKDLSEVTSLIRCEVQDSGGWRKMVSRFTTIRPAVRINEELEGPYAGSKTVHVYTPQGERTVVDVLCYMQSSELTPEEIKRDRLKSFATAFEEDLPYFRRFAEQHPSVQAKHG